MDEEGERLAGGNVGGAWRVGDTVHRTTGPWTPAVHALLDYLAPRLPHIPKVLGFDDRGREVLSYLPGEVVDVDEDMLTEPRIRSLMSWIRSFHEAVDGFSHPGPWRFFEVAEPTVIAHNDIAPYNICFDGVELVGVFDWDLAGPSTPVLELAFTAWNTIPLWRDIGAGLAATRLEVMASSYGSVPPRDILQAVPPRIQKMLDGIPVAAAAGDQGMVNLMSVGEPERSQRALDDLVRRIPAIDARLSPHR
jgi:8-oxo-dGTP diphosphatase